MTYPMTFRPLNGEWPGALTRSRRVTPFSATYHQTLVVLSRELDALNARRVVLQLDLAEGRILSDGSRPHADARPGHPGVLVSFDSTHGPLRYATDTFTHWHANLRGIALGLEALRKVDRYGITRRGEQYTGWKSLPKAPEAFGFDSLAAAIRFLDEHAPDVMWDHDRPDEVARAYRAAAAKLHPDAGGDAELFRLLVEARRVILAG